MTDQCEKSGWKKTRSLFNTIHLWLGVGSGLIIFVVCLTGTVYTFSTEIQKITDSNLHSVEVPDGASRLSAETLVEKVLTHAGDGVAQAVVIPAGDKSSYQVVVGKVEKDQKSGGRGRGTPYFVNPYTGEVLGTGETSSSEFFMVMFRMHRWLLLDTEIGRPIVGVATLIFVIIIITGMVIWVPKKVKNWKQGLTIKAGANWKRVNHDLHNALGLYASLFLLVMALTGLTWSFQWYKEGFVNMFSSKSKDSKPKELFSSFEAGAERATIATFVSSAEEVLAYNGDYRINLPSDSLGVVSVMKTGNGFFSTSVADRITLDQYSANVLATDLFSDKAFGDQVVSSIKAIHIGSFAGTFSKILYFITCLIGTSLPVTGIIIWINKLRKKREKPSKRALSPQGVA